ncbi:MAG: CRISPR-associated endonuclease Cas2 [Porticoccaceae bacterium]
MTHRTLHIAAYDICNARRLRKALYVLKDFACGGQKSVFECYLHAAEKQELLNRVEQILDLDEDRFLVVPIPGGKTVHVLGTAVMPCDPAFFYVG